MISHPPACCCGCSWGCGCSFSCGCGCGCGGRWTSIKSALTVCGDYEEDVVGFYGAVFQWWKIDRLLKENTIGFLVKHLANSKEK